VAFTDESTGMIDTGLWQFGDGASSDQQHPSREYTLTGTHTVTLTVSGPGGIDTEVKAGYISVSELAPPIPDIKANGTDGPLPVGTADRVNVSIALDPGDMGGTRCDWWGILLTRSGTKSLFRIQAPLRDLPATTVLNTALPRGWYTFVFALDDKPDGAFELDWYDFVVVTTTSVDGSPAEEMPDIEAIIRRQLRELRSLEAAGPAPWPAPE
jgi:PKD repeat protein